MVLRETFGDIIRDTVAINSKNKEEIIEHEYMTIEDFNRSNKEYGMNLKEEEI